jgi:Flp pilus assembly pilin Flp
MSDILLRPIIAMQVAVHQLREREDGQTTTEYAILLGFLAIAIIIALFFLRGVLRSLFSSAASSVSKAPVHTLCWGMKNHPFAIPSSAAQ